MSQVFPEQLVELNVCGGAVPFFKPFIEEYFNCSLDGSPDAYAPFNRSERFTPLLEAGGITKQVTKELQFNTIIARESSYSARFADVFCLMKYLIKKDAKAKEERSLKTQKAVGAVKK